MRKGFFWITVAGKAESGAKLLLGEWESRANEQRGMGMEKEMRKYGKRKIVGAK